MQWSSFPRFVTLYNDEDEQIDNDNNKGPSHGNENCRVRGCDVIDVACMYKGGENGKLSYYWKALYKHLLCMYVKQKVLVNIMELHDLRFRPSNYIP